MTSAMDTFLVLHPTTATWHPGGKGADQMGASLELRAFGEFLGRGGDGRKTWRNHRKKYCNGEKTATKLEKM